MLGVMRSAAEKVFGVTIMRTAEKNRLRLADLSQEIRHTIEQVQPYTMTSPERLAALCMSVEHVVRNNVPGVFVECGVWRGGSSMAAALTLSRLGRQDVDLYLFDTFEGMSKPGQEDVYSATGEKAKLMMDNTDRKSGHVWAYAPLELVRSNLQRTQYREERIHFVKGKVEDTIPENAPYQISILRLDTDWYESTRHELTHLYPRLSRNGVLIIDDYGAWAGARKAVDEFFSTLEPVPFLFRIDNTGRLFIKP